MSSAQSADGGSRAVSYTHLFVGRCADYALEDFDNCLSVYVHAPFEDRIKRIETEYGIVKEKSKEVRCV